MNKQERLVLKQLGNGQNYMENLPIYKGLLMESYHEYAMIQLAMQLYTMQEKMMDMPVQQEEMNQILHVISRLTGRYVVDHDYTKRQEELEEIGALRQSIIRKMRIITSYTDAFQIFEYICHRLVESEEEEVAFEPESYGQRLFQYIFQDKDKMVINSKIQMIVAELPVRITKTRFYEILNQSLKIYTGSECGSVDDFAETIRTCSGLFRPEGFDVEYPELKKSLDELEALDLESLSQEELMHCQSILVDTTQFLEQTVSDFMMIQEIINNLYAVMISSEYVKETSKPCEYAERILGCVLEAMANNIPIDELAEDCFIALEGAPEAVLERLNRQEALLYDLWPARREEITALSLTEEYMGLSTISKLLCNSIFMELKEDLQGKEIADSLYIQEVENQLVADFAKAFADGTRMVNRARMARVLGNVPVFFNSQQEIQEYFTYTLEKCKNKNEQQAIIRILDEIMED